MSKKTVFLTGFPGFLTRHLVRRLAKSQDRRFVFLIQEHLRGKAEEALEEQESRTKGFKERAMLVSGDITKGSSLGLSEEDMESAKDVQEVWHFAAIYDLSIDRSVAYRVNVVGTANVLDFCENLESLRVLNYISTCYVAGNREGRIFEEELDLGQGFKNHYESTKCWAEMEVRRRMDRLPVTVFRPGIVVGDSRTGETDKYDGPYYLIRGLLRLPSFVPVPFVGEGAALVNLVPVDYTIDAMNAISEDPHAVGLTFQLADPNPHTAREILQEMAWLTGHRMLPLQIPQALVSGVSGVKQIEELLQIPKETIVYFDHKAVFDITNVDKFLEEKTIVCPDLMSYLPILVDYVRKNPQKGFLDGRKY